MALKFLFIGKANARIDELEAQVAAITKERDDALSANSSNASEVAKTAEELQGQLTTSAAQVTKLTSDNATLASTISTQATEIASLKTKLAAVEGEVPVKVARQVAQTQAELGQ